MVLGGALAATWKRPREVTAKAPPTLANFIREARWNIKIIIKSWALTKMPPRMR